MPVTAWRSFPANNQESMTPESLRQMLTSFMAESNTAVIVEDGNPIFDLSEARYSLSGEYNKCLLHIWSRERNIVRRVLDAEVKGNNLRVLVQRMGQSRVTRLEICRERDRRCLSARRTARTGYENHLRRV